MDDQKDESKAIGGRARAEALTAEERQDIARNAALARWELPVATHGGKLDIGGVLIDCYVLENGERILSTRGIMKSLKRTWRGRKYTGTQLPVFLEANNLKAFISDDLGPVLSPVVFRTDKGKMRAEGYRAQILPAVCEVYLRARDAGDVLTPGQLVIAKQCEILVRGLSRVGIIALVDEATGYQYVRDRLALEAILDRYLRKEFAAWAKNFPDEFYEQIFRLRGWKWKGMKINRPQVVSHYTNDFVWSRLTPGLLKELRARNPRDEKGNRKLRYPQLLTDDIGNPALTRHLYAVVGLMRISDTWDDFKRMIDKAYPKCETKAQYELVFKPAVQMPGVTSTQLADESSAS